MKCAAQMTILGEGGMVQTSFFETVEAAKVVLDEFAKRLGSIREFSNRDEDSIFRHEAIGGIYAVDLRRCRAAAIQVMDVWSETDIEMVLMRLENDRKLRARAVECGLLDELERATQSAQIRVQGPK
jgi:hypothetical protein